MTEPFTTYLKELQRNLAGGNATEHTHRPALKNLLESLGREIIATNEPARIECGAPDFIVTKGVVPLGYVEAKDVGKSLDEAEKSEQVQRYLKSLGNFILTNYVEFRWYVDAERRAAARLASVARDGKLKRDRQGVQDVWQLLTSFLEHESEGVGTAKELAQRMARLAHLIRDNTIAALGKEGERGNLHELLLAFRDVLVPDLTLAQFADMYAQTIAYGLFAARCTNSTMGRFTRQAARDLIPRTNPFLRKLFDRIAGADLDDRISWLVDDLAQLLDRADMAEILKDFGRRTRKEDPVVHFYETFLAAYDPKVREMRGVYYTPEPVVSYIVRSIDYLLKSRFQRPLGLADPQVLILDPALGTGTFLYTVVKEIEAALTEQGQRGAWNNYIAEKLLPRLFGFELLMAPYAVAHLKLGLLLQETGYKFQSDQRLGIYLTNTLEEAIKKSEALFAKWVSDEANAAVEIKRELPIMVVLGNPPYSGISANRGEFITKLIDDYRKVDGKPLGEKKVWLKNDYIKFLRFAQWRIERTGYGILAFITDHSYLDSPTFRGMRHNLLKSFDEIYLLNLHGNAKRREKSPDGSKDENVFDITQGVAIGLFIKRPQKAGSTVDYADLWGTRQNKSRALAEGDLAKTDWKRLKPAAPFYEFVPVKRGTQSEYLAGWKVTDIFTAGSNGVQTSRDHLVVAFDKESLVERIESFADPDKSDCEVRSEFFDKKSVAGYAPGDTREWNLGNTRLALQNRRLWREAITHYLYRPFDQRFLLYLDIMVDWPREKIMRHLKWPNNALCIGRAGLVASGIWDLLFCTKQVCDHNLFYRGSSLNFPLYLYPALESLQGQIHPAEGRRPNLSPAFIKTAESKLGLRFIPDGRGDLKRTFGPEDVFHYAYGVFHSPTYRTRYAEFLKSDFPRLPLTSDPSLFAALAEKGAELVALHLMESPSLANLITRYPVSGSNLVERVDYVEKPPVAQVSPAEAGCSDTGKMPVPPGLPCPNRVYINKEQYFEGVPPEVWEFHIGGYQVCQKWLKDRKGRRLSYDDITHYQKIVVALKETIGLMAEIDRLIPAWPIA